MLAVIRAIKKLADRSTNLFICYESFMFLILSNERLSRQELIACLVKIDVYQRGNKQITNPYTEENGKVLSDRKHGRSK